MPLSSIHPPVVSVIVAAYNSADFLKRCLDSLENQTFRDFEIIVINSSPEHRTAEVVSKFPVVRFFQSPDRLLPHAARNAGMKMARGSLYAFTDADCRADPNWLAELVKAHSAGHEIVAGSIDSQAGAWISRAIYLLKYSPYLRGKPAGPIGLAATGSLILSRKVWDLAGPFDGSIFSGDALLSWKAREAGFPPWFEPKAIVVDQDEKYRQGFCSERFQRGREFGQVRADFENWSAVQRALRFLFTPLALLAALQAIAMECHSGKRLGDFVASLPLLVLAQTAWCLGEATGYVAPLLGGKDSRRSVPKQRSAQST
jgi:glycosyltransferase involved in cell wall biosynthesis